MNLSAWGVRTRTGLRRGVAPRAAEDAADDEQVADQAAALTPSASLAGSRTWLSQSGPAPAGESPLRSALSVLTTLGPPLTVVTALMFYFGWARSAAQARSMGLDVSLFGYSTQDYVMRSINTLYLPLLVVVAFALAWLSVHSRVVSALHRPVSLRALRTAGRVALTIGLLVVSAAVLTATLQSTFAPLVVPLALASGTATAVYAAWLVGATGRPGGAGHLPPWQRALRTLLVGGVITLALFWELSNYAGTVGRGYAMEIGRSVPALPRATVFSATPLGIQAAGVREERVDSNESAIEDSWRYRTTGLRFLVRSGGRMFLLHDGWTPERGTVIVLPDNEQLRWQFSR